MPKAVFQGTIRVPLFLAPYQIPSYNTTMAGAAFSYSSDWAMVVKYGAAITNTGVTGFNGLFYKLHMMNPFGLFTMTNNQSENAGVVGSTDWYVSVNGKMYGSYVNVGVNIRNFLILIRPWFMSFADNSNIMSAPTRALATNYVGSRARGISGLANFNPFQDICGFTINAGTLRAQLARPDQFLTYQDMVTGSTASGFNTQQFLSKPDRDLLSTHFLQRLNTTPLVWHTWSDLNVAIPNNPFVYDNSQVTIDDGLGAAFQTYFNQTTVAQVSSISSAPNAWTMNMLSGANPTPDNKCLLFDLPCRRYWKLDFINYSVPVTGSFSNTDVSEFKIDATGVAYAMSAKFVNASTGQIAQSYGFNLPWYPLPLNTAPAFQLPCPEPCASV